MFIVKNKIVLHDSNTRDLHLNNVFVLKKSFISTPCSKGEPGYYLFENYTLLSSDLYMSVWLYVVIWIILLNGFLYKAKKLIYCRTLPVVALLATILNNT